MRQVIYVSIYDPDSSGDGGYHRAYQLADDLANSFGKENISSVRVVPRWQPWRTWASMDASPGVGQGARLYRWMRGRLQRLQQAARRYLRNPYRLAGRVHRSESSSPSYFVEYYFPPSFVQYYEDLVRRAPAGTVCVLENSRFVELVSVNERYGMVTVFSPQNLESLDAHDASQGAWGVYSIAADLATEYEILARSQARLFISKVETGLIGGLGLPSTYYPYLPVNAIRERLLRIRRAREQAKPQPGLFLMVGSANHKSTRASIKWFCQQAAEHGLPAGAQVVVIGNGTDRLLLPGQTVPGLELRGWAKQEELDQLMLQAQAALVPQQFGFGALTKLPELSCSGIPAIVSRHPTYALEPPPGLMIVDDEWEQWCNAMTDCILGGAHASTSDDYLAWESRQPRPLADVIRNAAC